ncbi:MAG: carbohydrate kinase family protein [Candidatus Levybacteria bacterium]|nr:carbohydrate kinase family protein [Candidatus Levybacteria bacterium]
MRFDLIAVGNATVDEFLTIQNASEYIRLDNGELKIKAGEKIPVDFSEFLLGGNAANVSVGVARMGLSVALMAELGTDEFSEKIINVLKKENVSESLLKKNSNTPSSFSVILNFAKERTIFSQHLKKEHNFSFDNAETSWVYLTSLGEDWRTPYGRVLEFVKRSRAKLAFNPGTLQIRAGKESIAEVLKEAQILFLNIGEAIEISNIIRSTSSGQISNIEEILRALKDLGPKVVVVTDAERGSYLINEQGEVIRHGIVKVEVVEKTGAGDAYASGFLSAVLLGQSLGEAMSFGARNASSVISKVGAQTGLLRKGEVK